MKDTLESLRKKIDGAKDLESVVRTMKALAASSISQYENAVKSLNDYYRIVELGLMLSFRNAESGKLVENTLPNKPKNTAILIVFGSDQGLVGRFNEILSEMVLNFVKTFNDAPEVWAVGERIETRLQDSGLETSNLFNVPNSVNNITSLVGNVLAELESYFEKNVVVPVYIFHNHPVSGAVYKPSNHCLLPLDEIWQKELADMKWPTQLLPEIMGNNKLTQDALIREYLFVSLFRSCAESLAAENASRLSAMQRAEKNIGELIEDLHLEFHRLRQGTIDEELFDIIAGSEAQSDRKVKN